MSIIRPIMLGQSLLTTSALVRMAETGAGAGGLDSFTLADFAEMETDDIKAIKSLLFPAGMFGVLVKSVTLGVTKNTEGKIDEKTGAPFPDLYWVDFKAEVVDAEPLDKEIDKESLLGRTISERFTFWPAQMKELIGLLKGRYKEAGFEINGKLGGLEGGEPGWLDSAVDKLLIIRVRHGKPNAETGVQRAFYDWKKAPTQGGEQEDAA